jgi:hypothetical protein
MISFGAEIDRAHMQLRDGSDDDCANIFHAAR